MSTDDQTAAAPPAAETDETPRVMPLAAMLDLRKHALTSAIELGRVSGRLAKSDFVPDDVMLLADDLYDWLLGRDPLDYDDEADDDDEADETRH